MSLSLIEGYSSAEEEEERPQENQNHEEDSDEEQEPEPRPETEDKGKSGTTTAPPRSSVLPTALDAFSQISGPPQFLNNSVEEYGGGGGGGGAVQNQGRRKKSKKNDRPPGAVVEANAQLVGIRERVRSDADAKSYPLSFGISGKLEEKRLVTATNPSAEDAAALLRMCLQCGIPKTYSTARGMVCPVCGDRPPNGNNVETKKKGSAIKDKEKSKRMKGQSSHATWKSETEMQLRQQFD